METEKITTYKYRLYPTEEQKEILEREWFAPIRFLYNLALEHRSQVKSQDYDFHSRQLSNEQYREFSNYSQAGAIRAVLKELKGDPDYDWLRKLPSECIDSLLKDLNEAFQKFFNKQGGRPTRRTFLKNNSAKLKTIGKKKPDGSNYINVLYRKDTVRIPKLGLVKYKKHKKFYGKPTFSTIMREGNEYFICITTRQTVKAVEPCGTAIGIDLGVNFPMATSDGEILPKNTVLDEIDSRYRKLQKKFSRQKNKQSERRKRTKAQLADLKRRQTRCRKAYIHRATTELTKRYSYIAIEDLKVKNMTKSAKGDAEEHGKNVKAKSGLNRVVLNVAPYEMRSQLVYKAGWYGSHVEAVNPKNTSLTCPECGAIDKKNRKSQSVFECVGCGHTNNADINAARNILIKSGMSEAASGLRKTPSKNHQVLATSESIVSCFQPLSDCNSSALSSGYG